MGTIQTTHDPSRDLTIIKTVGRMKPTEFRKWIADYYSGKVTLLVLWDLTEADFSEIQTGHLRDFAAQTKPLAEARKGGKTAIVSENALEFGMSRMLEAFYDFEGVPFEVQTFHTIDKAMQWLCA